MSSCMGLTGVYGEDERRTLRPAVEWSLDGKMQRKIRIRDLEDKRNGIGVANPGDKGYGTSEHAPEYFDQMKLEHFSGTSRSRNCRFAILWIKKR